MTGSFAASCAPSGNSQHAHDRCRCLTTVIAGGRVRRQPALPDQRVADAAARPPVHRVTRHGGAVDLAGDRSGCKRRD
jgi:hypothetical protein